MLIRFFGAVLFIVSIILPGALIASAEPSSKTSQPRRLILLVGDGMGFEAIGLLRIYSAVITGTPSNFERALAAGTLSLMQPRPRDSLVIDSACSITELASGVDALPETLGLDEQGRPVESIAEAAKKKGLSVGIVSDTRITHATPAGFAAHVGHRSSESSIAEQMLDSSFDVLLSGGLKFFVPAGANFSKSRSTRALSANVPAEMSLQSGRKDNLNLLQTALARGYKLAFNNAEMDAVLSPPLLGLFANSAMQDAIEEHKKRSSQPSLAQMTRKTLALLEQNPKGFFAMIESGQIDWAEHSNDAGWLLHEMLRFDETLGVILDWMKSHPETTLVVTADHSTGGFGFSYTSDNLPVPRPFPAQPDVMYAPQHNFGDPRVLAKLLAQPISFARFFEQSPGSTAIPLDPGTLRQRIEAQFQTAITDMEAREISANNEFSVFYSDPKDRRTALLAKILAPRFGIVWSSGGHTSTPVPFIVLGEKVEQARKFLSATEAGQYLHKTLLQ